MRVLVTGGGGFVGGAIVRELLARGYEVSSMSRGAIPELAALGVHCVRANLGDAAAVQRALAGHELVFHCAAKAGIWGSAAELQRTNVDGTRHVLDACRAHGVRRLVFTSSPSVCFDGRDHVRASNDLPRAQRFLAPYPRTKAAAEALVLAANGAHGLATVALRPHLVFGPGDPHLLPRLVERARRGKLAIVGRGDNEVSLTYVENAALAHVVAAEALSLDAPHAGRAYFLGNREPVALWPWIDALLARLSIPPVRRRVPFALAYSAGATLELAWRALHLAGEPPMTRFLAAQLASSHSYDLAPAERDFGYVERVPMDEAVARSVAWLQHPRGR